MGNRTCCAEQGDPLDAPGTAEAEAMRVFDGGMIGKGGGHSGGGDNKGDLPCFGSLEPSPDDLFFKVTLNREHGGKLGLDVDHMMERKSLPIISIAGGLAELWNTSCPERQRMKKGDSIVEVNGIRGDVAAIMDACRRDKVLELTVARAMTHDSLMEDLENLVTQKACGPILIRLSWHDAGVFSQGKLTGGCPNAALRFAGEGEGAFAANAGLPTVALSLLEPISRKYCPHLLSHADLWALAANVAIRVMGGPDVATRFGRADARGPADGVASQAGRLPDGAGGAEHLRDVFYAKGFDDKAIVALSGAHTVGQCHADRSGFDGAWTERPLRFDNSYFVDLLNKTYTAEASSKGCLQHRHSGSGTIMLPSDLALVSDDAFKFHVERYARDRGAFFNDFTEAWTKLQESGCGNLREIL